MQIFCNCKHAGAQVRMRRADELGSENDNKPTTRSEDTNYIYRARVRKSYESNYRRQLQRQVSNEVYLSIGYTPEVALRLAFPN